MSRFESLHISQQLAWTPEPNIQEDKDLWRSMLCGSWDLGPRPDPNRQVLFDSCPKARIPTEEETDPWA